MKSLFLLSLLLFFSLSSSHAQVYFSTGLKIGEVSSTSAILQTRLCGTARPIPAKHERKEAPFRHPLSFDETMPVKQMDGAVAGKEGWVRFRLSTKQDTLYTPWQKAEAQNDFIVKSSVKNLRPNTSYEILAEGKERHSDIPNSLLGNFTTTPLKEHSQDVLFTVSSCQYFWDFDDAERGFKAYDAMRKLKPNFHCQTGDYVYYDKPGPLAFTVEQARHKWSAMNAWPSLHDFYNVTPLYLQKDDHDLLKDDASPFSSNYGALDFETGVKLWYEQAPVDPDKPFRSFRWGKDLELWLVEGREFRSDNAAPDGPSKTIWGKEQKAWIQKGVENSDATFKLIISPTPVVGPDRATGKSDNHANLAFSQEGDWLRDFLSTQKNTFVICGDRHWQYVSKDLKTGLLEFSSGATSDEHAQGWNPEEVKPEHRFLRVQGGFLSVHVEAGKRISFRHHDVDGNVVNEVFQKP